MNPQICLAICTYNRADLLREAIASVLEAIDLSNGLHGVLIVDNGSNDSTAQVVKSFAHPRLRYVFEPVIGLSVARNCALESTNADFVAYMDDDARLDRDWFREAEKILATKEVRVFGGPHFPVFPQRRPIWMPQTFGSHLISIQELRFLNFPTESLYGSNIVIHREKALNLGGFREDLGLQGSQRHYGEETELQERFVREGFFPFFSPRMRIYHIVNPEKYRIRNLVKWSYFSGRSRDQLPRYRSGALRSSLNLGSDFLYALYSSLRSPEPWLWKLVQILIHWAWVWGAFKGPRKKLFLNERS